MDKAETPYGTRIRVISCANVIKHVHAKHVLDYGCGTGNVTVDLADLFPGVRFVAYDPDFKSVAYGAKINHRKNIFYTNQINEIRELFNVVIVSNVIEHVKDPLSVIKEAKRLLCPSGMMILDVPNGHSIFEAVSFIRRKLHRSRFYMKFVAKNTRKENHGADTLCETPHVNFFSFKKLKKLILETGMPIIDYRGKMVACGFVLDNFIRGFLLRWNVKIAAYLPPGLIIAWLMVLQKQGFSINVIDPCYPNVEIDSNSSDLSLY